MGDNDQATSLAFEDRVTQGNKMIDLEYHYTKEKHEAEFSHLWIVEVARECSPSLALIFGPFRRRFAGRWRRSPLRPRLEIPRNDPKVQGYRSVPRPRASGVGSRVNFWPLH